LGHDTGPINLFRLGGYKQGNESFPQWLKADKLNLYSVWAKGKIPDDIKDKFGLTQEHMFPQDWVIEQAAPEEHAGEEANENAGENDDGNGLVDTEDENED
jgi:hypothetical protein